MKKLLGLSLVVFLVGVFSAPAALASPPGAAADLEDVGTVDYISLDDGKIVVGDVSYFVTAATPVVLPDGKITSIESLKKGTRVGFTAMPVAKGRATVITRIWVLPKDYMPPQEN